MQIAGKGWPEIYAFLEGTATRITKVANTYWNAPDDLPSDPVAAFDQRNVLFNPNLRSSEVEESDNPNGRPYSLVLIAVAYYYPQPEFLKVVSYNILAPTYIGFRWLRYPWATRQMVDTNYRVGR